MTGQTNIHQAIDAYHDALLRGLCHQGALEVALTSFPNLDQPALLHALKKQQATQDPGFPPPHPRPNTKS